jgi:hypothetical protein
MKHPNYKLSKQLAMQETWHFSQASKQGCVNCWLTTLELKDGNFANAYRTICYKQAFCCYKQAYLVLFSPGKAINCLKGNQLSERSERPNTHSYFPPASSAIKKR